MELTDKFESLRKLIQSAEFKIKELSNRDQVLEINSFCDALEIEVIESLQESIDSLNKQSAQLISQINTYRSDLLNSVASSHVAKRMKTEDVRPLPTSWTEIELNKLAKEVQAFSDSWTGWAAGLGVSDCDVDQAQSQARELNLKLDLLRTKLMSELFGERFLRFDEIPPLSRAHLTLGRLSFEYSPQQSSSMGKQSS